MMVLYNFASSFLLSENINFELSWQNVLIGTFVWPWTDKLGVWHRVLQYVPHL